MDNKEWCSKCPYYKVFYAGTETNPDFHEICYWSLKAVNKVVENDCKMFMISKELLKRKEN